MFVLWVRARIGLDHFLASGDAEGRTVTIADGLLFLKKGNDRGRTKNDSISHPNLDNS